MRAGCVSAAATGAFPTLVTGGAVQTTAKTTPAGLTTATTNRMAKRIRTGRDRRAAPIRFLLVREVFWVGGELADPAAVVGAPGEAAVALVARHVQELLLRDERAKPGEVRLRAVPHDAANNPRQLTPLPFRQRLAVTGDGDQGRRGGAGDRLPEVLVRLGPVEECAAW